MKKKMFLTAALLIGAIYAVEVMAQETFVLGIKAGYNSSKFTTDNAGDILGGEMDYSIKDDAKSGLILGAFARIRLINSLSFQPELLYAKKGGKTTYDVPGGNITLSTTYHTWDIPLLAHLRLLDLKVLNVYGLAGPMASFAMDDDNKFDGLPGVGESTFKDDIKTAQWSFLAGAGVEFWRLNFDVRYSWGINEVSNELERKNNNLTFSLGYKLFAL